MKTFKQFIEDSAPTNSVGTGNVDGVGVGERGEPGVHKKHQIKHIRRNKKKKDENEI